jgi:hypothetical protein
MNPTPKTVPSLIYLDCGGCQAERNENKRLVEFYERLHKIEDKVERIKENVRTQK